MSGRDPCVHDVLGDRSSNKIELLCVAHLPRTIRAMDLEHCLALFGRKSAEEVARKPEPESRGLEY